MVKDNMNIRIIEDIKKFYCIIGACNELAIRGFHHEDIMDESYIDSMNKLFERYDITLSDEYDFPDNYLDAENSLDYKFTELMKKVK